MGNVALHWRWFDKISETLRRCLVLLGNRGGGCLKYPVVCICGLSLLIIDKLGALGVDAPEYRGWVVHGPLVD